MRGSRRVLLYDDMLTHWCSDMSLVSKECEVTDRWVKLCTQIYYDDWCRLEERSVVNCIFCVEIERKLEDGKEAARREKARQANSRASC